MPFGTLGIGNNILIMGRTFIICIIVVGFSKIANGQTNNEADLKSRFRPGAFWFYSGIRPSSTDKPRKYDRLIFDVTYNDWIGDRGPFQNHWGSIGLNTNFIFDIPMTKGENVASFGVGLSHEYTSIRHDQKFYYNDAPSSTVLTEKDSSDAFFKSTLNSNSFSIPIEFRFRSKGWKHFKFIIGGKIGYQVNMNSKYISKIDGHRTVNKIHGFPDEGKLLYSAHLRFGLRNWALYAAYYFNPLFTNTASTKLNRIQMGLSISLF